MLEFAGHGRHSDAFSYAQRGAHKPFPNQADGKSPVKSRGKTGGSRRVQTGIETWDTMLNTRDRAVISQLISQKPQKVLIKSS